MMKKRFFLINILIILILSSCHNEAMWTSYGNFKTGKYVDVNDIPANGQNIVVAWMSFQWQQKIMIKTRASFDRGRTWEGSVLIPHVSTTYQSADPSMVFDDSGNLFLSYIDYRQNPDSGAVYVVKSTDGGLSWGNPVEVINAYADGPKRPIDRPWISVDASQENSATLYITTKPAPWILPPNRPYFVRSSDGGNTWDNWKYVDAKY